MPGRSARKCTDGGLCGEHTALRHCWASCVHNPVAQHDPMATRFCMIPCQRGASHTGGETSGESAVPPEDARCTPGSTLTGSRYGTDGVAPAHRPPAPVGRPSRKKTGDIPAHDAHIQGIRSGNLSRQKPPTCLCLHREPVACLLSWADPSRPGQRAAYAMVQGGPASPHPGPRS